MSTPAQHSNDPDGIWREWLGEILAAAAVRFGLTITGPPAYGWRDRSVGSRALSSTGPRWLRVVTADNRWACGDFWTGNIDANLITDISKPVVVDVTEWEEGPQRVRAEVMTLVPGTPCSPTDMLAREIGLPHVWWADLRRSRDALATTPTQRVCVDVGLLTSRIRDQLGTEADPGQVSWQTAHGDLHWANLCGPQFAILDWEGWGSAPAGLDAATLYCYSLTEPATARRVYRAFCDVLETLSGIIAQQYAIARLLARTGTGDHPELAAPLRNLASQLNPT